MRRWSSSSPRHPRGVSGTEFGALGGAGVVYVDTSLTEDIESEGYAHEIIRCIQEMRKDLDLGLEEEIQVELDTGDCEVTDLVERRGDPIKREVQAKTIEPVSDCHRETWDVEGVEIVIA